MSKQTKKYIALILIFSVIQLSSFLLFQLTTSETDSTSSSPSDLSTLYLSVSAPSWTNRKAATVQIKVDDPYNVGVHRIEYKIGNGKWMAVPSDFQIAIEEDCNFSVQATDNFGAVASLNKYLQFTDATNPELVMVQQQGDFLIITCKDDLSGVYSVIANGKEYTSIESNGSIAIPVDALGSLTLDVQIKDLAGNVSSLQSFTVAKPAVSTGNPDAIRAPNDTVTATAEPVTLPAIDQKSNILNSATEKKNSSSFLDLFAKRTSDTKPAKKATPVSGLINCIIIFGICIVAVLGYLFIKSKRGSKQIDDEDFIMYEDDDPSNLAEQYI